MFALKPNNNNHSAQPKFQRSDVPWLIGAIIAGGIAAPIVLLFGLRQTPASTASILLNFESVATVLIAFAVFKEPVNRQILTALALITLAGILLSWTPGQWGLSLGAVGIIGACFLWGADNNFTRMISENDPRLIVAIKGMAAGSFSLLLALILGNPLPNTLQIVIALALGSVSYGLSIQFFILALRELGAARTSALFGTAPIFGVILSILILKEKPQFLFWAALPMMMLGAWLMILEDQGHHHVHEAVSHTHEHTHPDIHHDHAHAGDESLNAGAHSHPHSHDRMEHSHKHDPDPSRPKKPFK